MQRGGGWPLTVFLTPDQEPFWGGTYFPPVPRHGMPGFPEVLLGVAEAYRKEPDQVKQNTQKVKSSLRQISAPKPSTDPLDATILDGAVKDLSTFYEPANGGLRRGAEVSHTPALSRPASPVCPDTGSQSARHGAPLALEDGGRRNLRPPGRRLPSLLDGRPMAGAALREDALRQRAARAAVPGRLAAQPRAPLQAGGRGDGGVPPPRDDPPGGRILHSAGRRQRRARGKVFHLGAVRDHGRPGTGPRCTL